MVSRREKLKLIGFGVAAGLLVGALAAEIYARAAGPNVEVSPENALEYTATLFSRHAFPRRPQAIDSAGRGALASYSLNDKGFRGRPFSADKPDGQTRIFVLGGSSVFDIHASRGRSWPQRMETFLARAGVEDARVINAGVPGHASWDALGRIYSEIWLYEPDYVLLYNCWNDLKYVTWVSRDSSLLRGARPKPTRGDGSHTVRNPLIYPQNAVDGALASVSQAYVRIRNWYLSRQLGPRGLEGPLEAARGRGADRPDRALRPRGERQLEHNLALFVEAVREAGARPVLVAQGRLVDRRNTASERDRIAYGAVGLAHDSLLKGFELCDGALSEVGRRKGVPVLRATRYLNGEGDVFHDHVHTNRRGSEALARLVGGGLLPLLR